jgi:hypothetical protein
MPKAYSRRLEVARRQIDRLSSDFSSPMSFNRELNILAVRPPCETELNSWLSWQLLSDVSI